MMDPVYLSITCIHKLKLVTSQPLDSKHTYRKIPICVYVKEQKQKLVCLAHTKEPFRMGEMISEYPLFFFLLFLLTK